MKTFLSGIPRTDTDQAPNVETHPASTLDAMEKRLRDIEQEIVGVTADLSRLGMRYMTLRDNYIQSQKAFCDRLKDSGVKAEPVRIPPELEM